MLLIQLQILLDCSDGELARWREQYSPAGIYLDRFGHYLTETLLPIGLGIRADGGWDSIGGYTTLGLLAAVLALLVRTESALVAVARLEAGKPAAEDTAAVAAPRASGLARLRRALGFFPFFRAFVAIEASLLALGRRDRRRVRRRRARPRARSSSRWSRSRRSPRPGTWSPSSPRAACGDVRLRRADDGPPAGRPAAGARLAAGPARGRARHRRGRQRVGADGAARRRARRRLAENLGIPAGRNLGVPHTRGELLFFLDDDASLAAPDALAAVARRFEDDPRLGLLQLRVAPRDGGASARDWVPRLRVGDRSRSSDITAVWEGAVAMRRAVFEAVGGWPADFRFVHEGIDLGWRVMDAGPPRRLRRRHRRAAPVADRHAARLLLLLRGAQPGLAGPPPPAAPARGRSTSPASCCARCRACARGRTRARRCAAIATACAAPAASASR